MENGAGQWSLTEANISGVSITYNVNIGDAVGGTFTLTVDCKTTAPLAWNVTATNLTDCTDQCWYSHIHGYWLRHISRSLGDHLYRHPTAVTMDKTGLLKM